MPNEKRELMRLMMLVLLFLSGVNVARSGERTALEIDPNGWTDLFPDTKFSHWKRVALDQGLAEKSPWSVDGELLVCQGAGGAGDPKVGADGKVTGVKEMLLYDRPLKDGIFHVEFRFQPLKGMHDYNSGAYVRSLDGQIWHQIQIAHLTIPPFMGDLFHAIPMNGKSERIIMRGNAAESVKPPGEWNVVEITAKGKEIQVRMNGHHTLRWQECTIAEGMVGVQSEFYNIEFRNLKFKPQ
jgi:hypothetical protein